MFPAPSLLDLQILSPLQKNSSHPRDISQSCAFVQQVAYRPLGVCGIMLDQSTLLVDQSTLLVASALIILMLYLAKGCLHLLVSIYVPQF